MPQTNHLAALLAVVAQMAVGFVWYSEWAFGTIWMEGIGLDPSQMGQPPGYVFPVAIACAIVISYGVSALMGKAGVRGAFPGAALGIFVGTALVGTTLASHHAFSLHSIPVMLVDAGKEFATFGLVGLIHGAWPAKDSA